MTKSIIASVIFLNSISCPNQKQPEDLLHDISRQIYSTLEKEELKFLSPANVSVHLATCYLLSKYANKFSDEIRRSIPDSVISIVQNCYSIQSNNNFNIKHTIIFTYVAFMLRNDKPEMGLVADAVNVKFASNNYININPTLNIDYTHKNIEIEARIIGYLDMYSDKILQTLSDKEKTYLAGASDEFISVTRRLV